uniref:Uncharacterized protein n=1 Tax=Rhizophora mucronata TaxID=61149 RepID=A0A2P2PLE9_RHIMU
MARLCLLLMLLCN